MTTIRVYDWSCAMCFNRADIGYRHASVAGTSYFTGRPQGETLALPKRMMIDGGGPQRWNGVAEVVRYSLQPNNFVRMPDPTWAKGRSRAVRALAPTVIWEGQTEWKAGATWGPYIGLDGAHSEGEDTVRVLNLPPNEAVFRPGDIIGVGGKHCMVRGYASSDADGKATAKLVRPLESGAADEAQVEYPVHHLFSVSIPVLSDQTLGIVYDWSGTFTEVFESEYPGVNFETASFFE